MTGLGQAPGASGTGCARSGEEWLAEFLMERLRKQYDWNLALNGRASMLLAVAGLALTLLLDNKLKVGDGAMLEVAARVSGFALLIGSAGLLLLALRNRPEAVWSAASLNRFVTDHRNASGEKVSVALVDRLLDGTARNERVLSSKNREIEIGTILALAGLVCVALGSIGM